MNKLISMTVACLTLLVLSAPAGWAAGGNAPLPEVQADDTGYVLTVGVTPAGAATLNRGSGETFAAGQSVQMSCQAIDDFVFDYWLAGDSVVSYSRSFIFTMPAQNTQLTAVLHYAPQSPGNPEAPAAKRTLTLVSQPAASATFNYNSGEQFSEGTSVYLECYVVQDFVFDHWQVGDSIVSYDQKFYFTMPAHDATLTAVCTYDPGNPGNPEPKAQKYTVTLTSKPAGAGTFSWRNSTVVEERSECSIYAYPNGDFTFREWQRDGQTVGTDQEYRFVMPSENINLVAVFDYNPANPGNPRKNYWDAATGEAIIDDFEPGNAYNELFQITGGKTADVRAIIVSGAVTQNDWGILNNCAGCLSLDLSRTYGMNYIPSYNFSSNTKLTTVVLPAGIRGIGERAFAGCSSLVSLTIYAVTPPTLGTMAFDGVRGMTVYVPAASVPLYQQAEGWKNFTILPIGEDVYTLTVKLPASVDVSIYKDMYIELINTASGQRQRYVITNSREYSFSSLIGKTSYNAYLRNAQGEALGEILGIDIVNSDVTRTFSSLKIPCTLTLTVLTPAAEDITGQTSITWLDMKGNYLSRSNTLANQLEGTTVKYRVVLPEELAMEYIQPEETEYVVKQTANDINLTLQAIPQTTLKGVVRDGKGSPLAGAVVAVSQKLNGQYSKSFTARTNGQGSWQTTAYVAESEITASMTGYMSQTQTFAASELTAEIPAFSLAAISGTNIQISLTYTTVNGTTQNGYPDIANVAFAVFNESMGMPVTDFSVQYPKIVLKESVPANTNLRVTATSKNQKFMPVSATATVSNLDRADITLVIKQLGGIKATYQKASNANVTGILYDADGRLVKKYAYDNKALTIGELQDGAYTLITMAATQLFNNIATLDQFAEAGLIAGTDYVKNAVNVSSGAMATVTIGTVPALDESKLYYTGNKTKISVNKSQVTVGQYITVSATLDFKSTFANSVSNVSLIVTLPANCTFVQNSVMVGKDIASYTLDGDRLIIPLATIGEQIRFCILPTKEGSCETAASVSFNIGGETKVQPIGSAVCNVKGLSIALAEEITQKSFVVSGTATPQAEVYIYVDDILAGRTTAKSGGQWNCSCTLDDDVQDGTEHEVYARVVTKEGTELLSETKKMIYDSRSSVPAKVSMSFYNAWSWQTVRVTFDLLKKTCSPTSYMFYSETQFTFLIDFTKNDPSKVKNVKLVAFLTDGSIRIISATYNANEGKWVATGRFSSYALPTTVRVLFNGEAFDGSDDGNAYCNPILDPSGFVYEAVSSNRLQGVTATAYYKETVYDMYGDPHENIVLWNAEEYAQENPLFTDELGMYQWDVPQGVWQVKFEKEGYQTTYSEWLPVPPPQLDVNIAMTQLRQPAVKAARAYQTAMEVEFDKFMLPELLTKDNIIVTVNGKTVEGTIELLDEEANGDENGTFASKVRFVANNPFDGQELTLTVKNLVESYAGIRMQDDFQQTLNIGYEIEGIDCEPEIEVTSGQKTTLTVKAGPVKASKGKLLTVTCSDPNIVSCEPESVRFDDNGEAEIVVTGKLPGTAALTFSVEGTTKTAQTIVTVEESNVIAGDANGDGSVDVRDMSVVLSAILAGTQDQYVAVADMNGDGTVDVRDLSLMLSLILGK